MMINRKYEVKVPRKFDRNGIDPGIFYGNTNTTYSFQSDTIPQPIFSLPSTLCGPSTVWEIFKKQQDVLDFVTRSNLELLPFTYQNNEGNRLFIAAHPKNFWYKDEQKKPEERHSYEIVQEHRACKLYFDLEFEPLANRNHRGDRMVNTFIALVCAGLQNKFGIERGCKDVLILDSSSSTKYSCHLIFPNVVFKNNLHVGYFVKQLCCEIKLVGVASNLSLLKNVQPCEEISELFVLDAKSRRKCFCDEAVYTKNRHFRLYKSSKFGKNIPLKVSERNQLDIFETETESRELNIFLCSLISYCPQTVAKLIYECDFENELSSAAISSAVRPNRKNCGTVSNPFVEIDRCISDIVQPGSIYRSRYYPEKRVLVYDIVGYRYCGNIGRQHKSNNVKYVVDVNTLSYYQRCYDPDCADFKSASTKLSVDESIFLNHDIDDRDFLLLPQNDLIPQETYSSYREPAFSSSEDEEDLIEAAERCEFLNRSRGKLLFFQDADDDLMTHVAEECEKSQALDGNDDDDQLMISVAGECEAMMLSGKRKLSEHLEDDDSLRMLAEQKENYDNDDDKRHHDKRKMIRADDSSSQCEVGDFHNGRISVRD